MIRMMVGAFMAVALAAGASAAPRPPAEAFARPDAFRHVALSADGTRLAVVAQHDSVDVLEVFHADRLSAGPTATYKLGAAPWVGWIKWKGDRLVLGVDIPDRTSGLMLLQTRMMSTDEHLKTFVMLEPKPHYGVTPPQFQDDVIADLPDDPNGLLVAVDWVDPLHPAVYRIDPRDASAVRVKNRASGITGWLADPDGGVRVGFGDPVMRKTPLFAVGAWEKLTPLGGVAAGEADFSPLAVDGDPDRIVVASNHEDGVLGLYAYSLSRQAITATLFKNPRFDVAAALMSPDGRRVVGARYVDDQAHNVYFDDAARQRTEHIAALAGAREAAILDQTADGRFVVAGSREGGRITATYWIDLKSDEVRPLGRFHPDFDAITFGRVTPVSFKARDGVDIPGYVTLPPGVENLAQARGLPFVVMPHGGPGSRDDMDFNWWAQFVATRGYAVFQPNFRGSTGYGEAFRQAGDRAWGTTVMNDVVDGARWLVAQGLADPGRMCVAGWSFGGYVALEAAVEGGDLFRCASATAGVSDLPRMLAWDGEFYGGTLETRRFVGDIRREGPRLEAESPLRHVETITVPVLLVHGLADATVPVEQSRLMNARLTKAGKQVKYLEFDLADHSLTREKHRLAFLKALEAFLDTSLGPP